VSATRVSRSCTDDLDGSAWREADPRGTAEPLEGAPPLAGLVAFSFGAVDAWWEEAERIDVHPRDPYHRCDVVRSDRHVVVRIGGEVVADSRDVMMLFETGLPYDDPRPEVAGIEGLIAFYNERVDLEVDDEPWQRPVTKFS
jgi:hypothetical protein